MVYTVATSSIRKQTDNSGKVQTKKINRPSYTINGSAGRNENDADWDSEPSMRLQSTTSTAPPIRKTKNTNRTGENLRLYNPAY